MSHFSHLEIRCSKLGHDVAFSYCCRESGYLPCSRILACWQPFFPVEAFLKKHMPPDRWQQFISQTPKGKVVTLIDLIEAARKREAEKK